MKFRAYKNTDLTVSEVGFGLWTVSTGWWGNFTQGEAIALMHKAFDLGVTLFDAADTYGNGLSEELIAKAFPNQRDEIVPINSDISERLICRRSAIFPAVIYKDNPGSARRLNTLQRGRLAKVEVHSILKMMRRRIDRCRRLVRRTDM